MSGFVETPRFLRILEGGDLRSDGRSNELVEKVLANIDLLPELIHGLNVSDKVVRGRVADVLEKVARVYHEKLVDYLPILLVKAVYDDVFMVRFHLAMILGYLEVKGEEREQIVMTLYTLLDDESAFVVTWSIVSLTVIGLEKPEYQKHIIERFTPLLVSDSKAVKRKAENAVATLKGEQEIPKGWVKKASP